MAVGFVFFVFACLHAWILFTYIYLHFLSFQSALHTKQIFSMQEIVLIFPLSPPPLWSHFLRCLLPPFVSEIRSSQRQFLIFFAIFRSVCCCFPVSCLENWEENSFTFLRSSAEAFILTLSLVLIWRPGERERHTQREKEAAFNTSYTLPICSAINY